MRLNPGQLSKVMELEAVGGALPGVEWVETKPESKLFNASLRWLMQSGDAESKSTSLWDAGLYGSGQIVARAAEDGTFRILKAVR